MVANFIPTIVGEWALATDDCTPWLNGFKQGNRKTDMGLTCGETHSLEYYQQLARNQLWVWEKSDGWIFWNFKNEKTVDWSWFQMVENGWVPRDARTIPEFVKGSTCQGAKQKFLEN